METLKNKVALITGSSSGIGLGIAKKLAMQNMSVVLHGMELPETIADQLKEIQSYTENKCIYIQADLSKVEDCHKLIDDALKQFNCIDVLVNNAGIQHVAPIEDFSIEKWNLILAINLSSVFYCTQKVLPLMRAQNFGRIINIASAHGLVGSAYKSAYVAAKHGVVGLSKVIALETAKENITCNSICPGWVYTPLVEKQIIERAKNNNTSIEVEKLALLSEKQPSQKFVTAEQIGGFVLFLCGPDAEQITGSAHTIDGGWTIQ